MVEPVLAREESAGKGVVDDRFEADGLCEFGIFVVEPASEWVVDLLARDGIGNADFARDVTQLGQLSCREVRDAKPADLAFVDERGDRFESLPDRGGTVGLVEVKEVDAFPAKSPKASFER